MTYHKKSQITLIIIAPPDQVAEGDRSLKAMGLGWRPRTIVLGRKLF
jgi:hypothetical protein